jgi:hypothetical protein
MIPLSKPGRGSMKAKDAVENLRKLADLLEKHGDAEIYMSASNVWIYGKQNFLEVAKDFPRPCRKATEDWECGDFKLMHGDLTTNSLIALRIPRTLVCNLIEPAKPAVPAVYDCPDVLGDDAEGQLTA